MTTYNKIINDTAAGALIPPEHSAEIIKEAPKSSAMLTLARKVPMSTKQKTQPVLSTLPEAYWVNGTTGMKQTTDVGWSNMTITAEEIATLVVIPDAVIDDSDVPLWEEVKPLLAEAVGRKIDQATIFGVDKPSTFPDALVAGATAAGNTVKVAAKTDLGVATAQLGEKLAKQGYAVNAFAGRPGLNWMLTGLRDANGQPIYSPAGDLAAQRLYGFPLQTVENGAWDDAKAELVAADWSRFVVGLRQDITYTIHSDAVITDDSGRVIFNAMQQDSKIMRVVMRVGFQVNNPAAAIAKTRYPAGLVLPATTTAGAGA